MMKKIFITIMVICFSFLPLLDFLENWQKVENKISEGQTFIKALERSSQLLAVTGYYQESAS